MIILDKVSNYSINRIVRCVNNYIRSIPKHPKNMLLNENEEDYWSGPSYWHLQDKGYYQVLRLYDHAGVIVDYVGKDESEMIANIFQQQIEAYYPYAYVGDRRPGDVLLKEFQDYCYSYVHLEKPPSAYTVSTNMKEISIPTFLKDNSYVNESYAALFIGYQMCFDEKLGYLYIIPLTNNRICVRFIGKNEREALYTLLRVVGRE